ncbi:MULTISPECIES: DegT/DnrJ/EryC1/StrS aminotransferase family protein [Cycloclasticus]|uniref:Aminotransferase n=1 Tax=Cycloclasticus pugetii TaxID=34068 RepID=A0AB33YYC4_9GAMM|nr:MULTISPECIES: DegT/DnrJ/EryC1/StrS family aminotransferase [Cycloclasticus]ATI03998.1 DegT/DnrJ/EryC1/StrS family aminotransferase [Cycloclasticus sp. PY97N]EPD12216.1 aminotransferase [Cycloclasticus pugetii]
MKIDFANLQYQYQRYKKDIDANIQKVLDNSNYIMGEEVQRLERELEKFTQAQHAITCSSGTDALLLALMAIDIQPDDEVITTTFSFIATAETIALMKAQPVFVDIEESTFNIDASKIEAAITSKTKAIMPVSLYGQPADMDEINAIAKKYNLKVIIDGAQSFGATYKEQAEVHHCDVYTTSFFPSKPLGCYGDGGAVFTNNDEYAEKIRMLRVHGQNKRYQHKYIGLGARLDTLQAAVLLAKLPFYAEEVKARQAVAKKYNAGIKIVVATPRVKIDRTSVWAQYTIRTKKREQLQWVLKENGVSTPVHYPLPLHLQECFNYLDVKKGDFPISEQVAKEVLSLPMNAFMNSEVVDVVSRRLLISIDG